MTKIRNAHGDIRDALTAFSDLVGSRDDTTRLLTDLDSRLRELDHALRGMTDDRVAAATLTATRQHLDSIGRAGRTLTAIATLTRTTAASLDIAALSRYLTDLSRTADTILSAVAEVSRLVGQLDRTGRHSRDGCREAAGTLSDLFPTLQDHRARLDRLAAQEQDLAADIADRALRLTETGRSHLKVFVTAMQFSDRLAQRLDHLQIMLGRDTDALAGLAAAQLRQCETDLRDVIREVRDTMAAMAKLGRDGAALFSEGHVAEASAATLGARGDIVGLIRDEIGRLAPLVRVAQDNATTAARVADSARDSFDRLSEGARGLAVEAINSMLLSGGAGEQRAPLVTLSTEVRATATLCLSTVDAGQEGLDTLRDAARAARGTLTDAADGLQAALQAQNDMSEAGADRLHRIEGLRGAALEQARGLLTLVDVVQARMARADALADALAALASDLAPSTNHAPPPFLLAEAWALYTMEDERMVHAALYGTPDGVLTSTDTTDDTLEDLLF